MLLCLQLDQPSETAVTAIAACAPRIAVEAGARVWVDARGLSVTALHERVAHAALEAGAACRSGAAATPIAAQLASGYAEPGGLCLVPVGSERNYIASFPLSSLEMTDHLLSLLEGVGVSTCGDYAALPMESVEVRFGGEAVRMWRLARGDDDRRLFRPVPPDAPHASIDFVDYVVTDPERLLFTGNALLGTICDALVAAGSHARRMLITLPLADGARWQRELRPARATADRAVWLRLLRSLLERLSVSDAVAGMHLEVRAAQAASAVQGDLFDSGFGTAGAVEEAVSRLIEQHDEVLVRPVVNDHVLAETRVTFEPLNFSTVSAMARVATQAEPPIQGLTLQLLPQARPILVETVRRRDHAIPVRYRDGEWRSLLHAAGPDRVSGGQWDQSYAREYYRAVCTDGTLVWLFRDACTERWYLHGWWD